MHNSAAGKSRPLVSLLTPVFNEARGVDAYFSRVNAWMDVWKNRVDFELILTDNASTDDTYALLLKHARTASNIRLYRFSKNVGYMRSTLYLYKKSRGDAVIIVDADGQDPLEIASKMLSIWFEGSVFVVAGQRRKRKERLTPFLKNTYFLIRNMLTNVHVPRNVGEFAIVDRKVVNAVVERTRVYEPYMRSLIFSFGFPYTLVPFERKARYDGKGRVSFRRSLSDARTGIINDSTQAPLRLAFWIGGFYVSASIALTSFYVLNKFFHWMHVPLGLTSVTILLLLLGMIQVSYMGLLGEYIGQILRQMTKPDDRIVITSFPEEEEKK